MNLVDTMDAVEAGRRLGHDLHRLCRIPPQPCWPPAVREGFEAAAASRAARPRQDDRFVRKWLQLRLGALVRGRAVAADVTVDLLHRLDVSHCPVTREPLTYGTRLGRDASVDRLNNDGAYAASNLAMLSARVNRIKGGRSFDEVLALSRRAEPTSSLAPVEWLRLAVLMLGPAHATQPQAAPALPLCAPLPATSVRTALQQVQRLLTVTAGPAASRNRLLRGLLPACGSVAAEARLKLLADAVHLGLKRLAPGQPCWDVWLQPGLMTALLAWRDALTERAWAHTSWTAGQLAGGQPVSRRELAPWQLATRGYWPAAAPLTRAATR
ncbi:hypothetical protein [Pelomonas cellulosilytica]|uniref:Uncharacterized protein n=1 Tax=Pelomonas cellulosilytica TaxID=2906762 RepID=A0ABS8XZ75_9BURK|nr:hypothetical protein [Pelomonas sp. P8]MCE4556049.1 hypothetical protein [Pelomonas sp. P8]